MNRFFFVGGIFLLLTLQGCWPPPSTITTANITQPVLVGKVISIGGERADKKNMYQSNRFSTSVSNDKFIYSAIYAAGWRTRMEGSNTFDKQLLPIVDAAPNDSTTMIMVDSIRFSVSGGYWLLVLSQGNYGWLDGAKYSETNPELQLVIPSSVEVPYNSTTTTLDGLVSIKCTKRRESAFFSTITLSFEGILGVDKNENGSFGRTSITAGKGDKFYIRTNSLLIQVEVIQETDLGLTLAFNKQ